MDSGSPRVYQYVSKRCMTCGTQQPLFEAICYIWTTVEQLSFNLLNRQTTTCCCNKYLGKLCDRFVFEVFKIKHKVIHVPLVEIPTPSIHYVACIVSELTWYT